MKLLVVALVCMGWTAFAAPERIRVSYDAVAGCPDRDHFVGLIATHARVVVDDSAARSFHVSIGADDVELRGVITVGDSAREVRGATCDEVASAIALVAALAIEDQPVRESHAWRFDVGGGVGVFTGASPTERIGAPIFVAAAREHGPRLRVAFDLTSRDAVAEDAGSTSFRWSAGRVDGCPFAWTSGPFEVAPCLGLEVGALDARGIDVAMAATSTRPWIAPDAIVRVAARIGRATIGAEGSVGVPLVRDRFVIGPDVTIYQVPVIATSVALTLALEIL